VSDNGALFGKGIYFADQIDKSINYTDLAQGSRYLLLCEVALGKMLEVEKLEKFKGHQSYQSVKGCGRFEKDMN